MAHNILYLPVLVNSIKNDKIMQMLGNLCSIKEPVVIQSHRCTQPARQSQQRVYLAKNVITSPSLAIFALPLMEVIIYPTVSLGMQLQHCPITFFTLFEMARNFLID